MKRLAWTFLLILSVMSFEAKAAPAPQEIAVKVIEDFIIPAYDDLAQKAEKQSQAWQKGCTIAPLKKSFHQVSDAWAQVQFIAVGPVTLLLRKDRLYHWPERRNAVSKSLNGLIAKKDKGALNPENFVAQSVAAQGLPALERLIYGFDLNDVYSCQLGQAIAKNIAEMTHGTAKEWRDVLKVVKAGESHPIYFESMDEITTRLFTEMLTGFQIIADQKLALPLGSSIEKANGKRAEGWRSGRTTRNLQQTSLGIMKMSRPFQSFLSEEDAEQVVIRFSLFARGANNLPLSIDKAVTDHHDRARLMKFRTVNQDTRNFIVETFTKGLGLTVGFNSLDGD